MSTRMSQLLVVSLALALSGCALHPGASQEQRPLPAVTVSVAPVAPAASAHAMPPAPPGTPPSGAHVGVIIAGEQTSVSPLIAGDLVAVHVRAGDRVEEGQPLATLDARRAGEELRIAEATLRSEEAALREVQVDREEGGRRFSRAQSLNKEGLASERELDDAQFQWRRSQAAEARRQAVVSQWKTKRGQLIRQLADTELRAPFSGVVAERYLDPGATAGPGSPVVRLISSDVLWARFAVPPEQLSQLSPGDKVVTRIESSTVSVPGTIRQVAPETDAASQLAFVDAELELSTLAPELRAHLQVGAAAWVERVNHNLPDAGK